LTREWPKVTVMTLPRAERATKTLEIVNAQIRVVRW
jgi:hypothetical protein